MSRTFLVPLALLLGGALLAAFGPAKKQTLTLEQAIADNIITAELISQGGHAGDCVKLKLKNKTRKSLNIVVDSGTLLYPEDEGDQTLVVPQQQILALEGEDGHSYKLPGYCTEASDRSPKEGGSFRIGSVANDTLTQLLEYFAAHETLLKDENVVQNAIWSVTDKQNVSSIYRSENEEVVALRQAVCEMTGRPNVWYNTVTNTLMQGDRRIVREPAEISGKVKITSRESMKVTAFVLDEDDKVVYTRPGETPLRPGTGTFTFRMKVRGWPEGDYRVVYMNQADTVHQQVFHVGV